MFKISSQNIHLSKDAVKIIEFFITTKYRIKKNSNNMIKKYFKSGMIYREIIRYPEKPLSLVQI